MSVDAIGNSVENKPSNHELSNIAGDGINVRSIDSLELYGTYGQIPPSEGVFVDIENAGRFAITLPADDKEQAINIPLVIQAIDARETEYAEMVNKIIALLKDRGYKSLVILPIDQDEKHRLDQISVGKLEGAVIVDSVDLLYGNNQVPHQIKTWFINPEDPFEFKPTYIKIGEDEN